MNNKEANYKTIINVVRKGISIGEFLNNTKVDEVEKIIFKNMKQAEHSNNPNLCILKGDIEFHCRYSVGIYHLQENKKLDDKRFHFVTKQGEPPNEFVKYVVLVNH